MINIPIEKRREYLKKIYNALNASPISHTYTPEKIKDIAITSEYECCENSQSESEYYSGIVQIIQRILSTIEKQGPDREGMCRPLKSRPAAISNPQVFFSNTVDTSSTFNAVPGIRGHKTSQRHLDRPEFNINNMYMSRTLDPNAKMSSIPAPVFNRHNYPKSQTVSHVSGQGDFASQYASGLRSYQMRDYIGPRLLRHPDVINSNGTQSFRKWDTHDRDLNRFHNIRVTAPVRGGVLRSFEDTKIREGHKNASRVHVSFSEAGIPAHGNVSRTSPFLSATSNTEEGSALRPNFVDTDVLQRNTKEDAFKTPYSYTQSQWESQKSDGNSTSSSKYAENAGYSYGPQYVNASIKPNTDTCGDTQVASLVNLDGLGGEILEFDLCGKLADVAIDDEEKKVIRNKLSEFQEELFAIEADVAKHARLGCSPDLNKKLETTCRIIRAQIEHIKEHKYFLKEVFLDVAIERIRKYAVLIRDELHRAHKSSEVYDFTTVCERVTRAFRRMKSADSTFVFCIDP